MSKKRFAGWVMLLCMLFSSAAFAHEVTEQTLSFGLECPSHIRRMLDENGWADGAVICGASIEREGYDGRGMPTEVSYSLLLAEKDGQRSLTGLQWVIGTSSVRIENYAPSGLDLESAVSLTPLVDGDSPINRRFVLRMADSSAWEFVATYKSDWRVYRFTGADGFTCTLNSGRLFTDAHYFYLPHSGWLGNWPDLSRFPASAEDASNFMGQCWEGVNDRSLVWGANLREKPTGSSRSLGEYHVALAEVLDEKPGKTQPWYRVRIGNAEGWMSGPYVVDPTDQEGFAHNGSLGIPWADTQRACPLYASMDDGSVLLTLPPQTFMQVLAETEDGWAHVLVTDEPQDHRLTASGTYGYVRLTDVRIRSPWTGE